MDRQRIGDIIEAATRSHDDNGTLAWVTVKVLRHDGDVVEFAGVIDPIMHAGVIEQDIFTCIESGNYTVTRGSCILILPLRKRGKVVATRLFLTPPLDYETHEEYEQRMEDEEEIRKRMKKVKFMQRMEEDADNQERTRKALLAEERTRRLYRDRR